MLEKLEKIEIRFEEIEDKLCKPKIISDRDEFTKLSRERSEIEALVVSYRELKKIIRDIERIIHNY